MKKIALIFACSLMLCLSVVLAYAAEEKWPGVDDTVVGKYASEHGRPAKPGFIDLEGDALLFAFLIAGAVGGFTMGYYYRDFTTKKDVEGKINAG
jgi:hypothetical protein